MKIKDLKEGYGITHSKYGYMQYRGLVTKNPFTNEPKIPHQYLFWLPVDINGKDQPDIILTNGNEVVILEDTND